MASAREWVAGARPRTLPAAIVPVVVGTGVALGYGRFSWWRALLALAGGLALVLLAPGLGGVVSGLLLFGTGTGLIYYSALYYSLAVGHAQDVAGGEL